MVIAFRTTPLETGTTRRRGRTENFARALADRFRTGAYQLDAEGRETSEGRAAAALEPSGPLALRRQAPRKRIDPARNLRRSR
jgi:hypothetical protein